MEKQNTKTKVYYTSFSSPLGTIWAAATEKGLCAIEMGCGFEQLQAVLVRRITDPEFVAAPNRLQPYVEQLSAYFRGELREFAVPLDLWGTDFQKQVWQALCKIPYGETRTYRDIAAAVGNPKACRAVGNANGKNPIPIIVPCHRVVAAGGKLGGYSGGLDKKEFLLKLEGIL